MTFGELSCELPATTSALVASDFATAFLNPAFRGPVAARISSSSRRNSRTESLDAALNDSEEGGSARFRASCAMPDAVHAITPIRIAHRNNSNQLVIRMSPPAPLHTKSLYFRFAFHICISDLCSKNSQQKLCPFM